MTDDSEVKKKREKREERRSFMMGWGQLVGMRVDERVVFRE